MKRIFTRRKKSKLSIIIKVICIISMIACTSILLIGFNISINTPNRYIITDTSGFYLPSGISIKEDNSKMMLMDVIPIKNIEVIEGKTQKVVPSGKPFGIKIFTEGVVVVGIDSIKSSDGKVHSPGKEAGIKKGDVIIKIDENYVNTNEEVSKILGSNTGKEVNLLIRRDNLEFNTKLNPIFSQYENLYRAGIWIRDSCAGIGTMTFYDMSNEVFAGLGHGICDSDTEELLPLSHGDIVQANINGVIKGNKGMPGELRGSFDNSQVTGSIYANTNLGIFGKINNNIKKEEKDSKCIDIATKQQVHQGNAKVLTTICGEEPRYYEIYIDNINYNENNPTKNMIIKIVDPQLLNLTGGIVQGMSGSPIIQDDRLIGAVTHVFINEPNKGYAIFAENMINKLNNMVVIENNIAS